MNKVKSKAKSKEQTRNMSNVFRFAGAAWTDRESGNEYNLTFVDAPGDNQYVIRWADSHCEFFRDAGTRHAVIMCQPNENGNYSVWDEYSEARTDYILNTFECPHSPNEVQFWQYIYQQCYHKVQKRGWDNIRKFLESYDLPVEGMTIKMPLLH